MPQPETNLALAVRRPGLEEDTLTEVLAGVLALDPALARRVYDLVPGCHAAHDQTIDIRTQHWIRHVGKLDMMLDSSARAGGRCWVENKLDAAFQPGQLIQYASLGWPGLVIVPERRLAETQAAADSKRWTVCTWPDIADLAMQLLDQDGITVKDARLPTAEARHKARADLIGYLQEIGEVALQPLDENDAVALTRVAYVLTHGVPTVLDAIRTRGEALGLHGASVDHPRPATDYWGWVAFSAQPGTWVEDLGGWYDANVAGDCGFADGATFWVGMTFNEDATNDLQALFRREEWQRQLENTDLRVVRRPNAKGWRAVDACPVAELPGQTLGQQAQHAATRFEDMLDRLRQLQPTWDALKRQHRHDPT